MTTADYAENGMDAVATYTADGPDAGMAAWMLMGDDADAFSINNGGELTFAPMPNYEMPTDMGMDNVYQVTVQATAGGEMDMVDVTVTVTNVDEMGRVTFWRDGQDATNDPIMVGDMLTGLVEDPDGFMDERRKLAVGQFRYRRRDLRTHHGRHGRRLHPGRGRRRHLPTGDGQLHRRPRCPGKTAMAVSANMVSMAITNTAPAFPAATAERMVAENTEAGEDVGGPVAATDDDTGDTLTYTLGGTDMASFDIDDATGQITDGMGTMLDYEATQNTYMVTVTVADAAGEMDMVTVTVTVTNVAELGMVSGDATRSDYAGEPHGCRSDLHADGPDAGMATWMLMGDDADDFSIDGGVLTFKASPDFETPTDADTDNVYQVTVEANVGGEMDTHDVMVTVTDVDEGMPIDLLTRYDANQQPRDRLGGGLPRP